MKRGRITIVCAGNPDAGLLTVRAALALADAGAVVVDAGYEETARAHTSASVEVITVSGDRSLSQRMQLVKDALTHHGHVVRLISGDPVLDGALAIELPALEPLGEIAVVPGITTAATAAAFGGFSLTGKRTRELRIVYAGDPAIDWNVTPRELLTVKDAGRDVGTVFEALLANGTDAATAFRIVTSVGTTAQRSINGTIGGWADVVEMDTLDTDTVIFVGEPVRSTVDWFEQLPLFGWNVLVPRTKDPLAALTGLLEQHGAHATHVATLAVEPPRTPQQMDRAVAGLVEGSYGWIVLTCANAFTAVWSRCQEYGLDARALAGTRIAAVGADTLEALSAHGLRADLVPSHDVTTQGLLQEFLEAPRDSEAVTRVLIPRADIATETLATGLQELGWEVDEVTAFRTVRSAPPAPETRDAIKGGAFDAVAFTSSATVRNLIGLAGKPGPATLVACIGPSTARTAEEHGLRVDVIAEEPTHAALARALADLGRERIAAGQERPSLTRPGRQRVRAASSPTVESARRKAK